jgi:branched-chain amino acid transport system ATP-binding protein
MAQLELRAVHVSYGVRHVLRGVDLTVGPGLHVMLGANGSGKSTLLKAVHGLVPRSGGQVALDGKPIAPGGRAAVVAGIGIALQGGRVFTSLTVEENLHRGDGTARGHAEPGLELFPELRARMRSPAGALSGGLRQQLALAVVLGSTARVLLLDEPTAGLSPPIARRLLAHLRDEGAGRTILMVEQNIGSHQSLFDRLHVLKHGRIAHSLASPELGELTAEALGRLVFSHQEDPS